MKQLDNNNHPSNKSTNAKQQQIRFHFLIEITLGIILLGSTCLLTGVLGIGEYYLKGKWITEGAEIVAIIAVLLAFSILGVIFFIKGLERLSAGAVTYIFNLIRNFRWDELFNYQKEVFLYARKIVKREPIQQDAIPVVPKPVDGETREAKRERFIFEVNIIIDEYIQNWSKDAISIRKQSYLFSGPKNLSRKFMMLIQPMLRWLKTQSSQSNVSEPHLAFGPLVKFENEQANLEKAINVSTQNHSDNMISKIRITIIKFGYSSSLSDEDWDKLALLLKPELSESIKSRTKSSIGRLIILFGVFIALVIILPLSFFIEIILLPIILLIVAWRWLNEGEETDVNYVVSSLQQRKSKAKAFILEGLRRNKKTDLPIKVEREENQQITTITTVSKNTTQSLQVFLCHSSEDKLQVKKLYQRLKSDGVSPWLDAENLLPGQDWPIEIPKAVRKSDIVIVCLSKGSINREGFVQKEIKEALDVADQKPPGTIFIIPLKLEECDIPERLSKLQWVNLFDDIGYDLLMRALNSRANTKNKN